MECHTGMHRKLLWGGLAWTLLVAGCGGAKEVKVGAAANGSEIAVQQGQAVVVALESNPSTGYGWEVAQNDGGVLVLEGEPQFESVPPQGTPLLGAGGTQTFRFKTVGSGSAELKLVYHRSWETNVPPLQVFDLKVVVR